MGCWELYFRIRFLIWRLLHHHEGKQNLVLPILLCFVLFYTSNLVYQQKISNVMVVWYAWQTWLSIRSLIISQKNHRSSCFFLQSGISQVKFSPAGDLSFSAGIGTCSMFPSVLFEYYTRECTAINRVVLGLLVISVCMHTQARILLLLPNASVYLPCWWCMCGALHVIMSSVDFPGSILILHQWQRSIGGSRCLVVGACTHVMLPSLQPVSHVKGRIHGASPGSV